MIEIALRRRFSKVVAIPRLATGEQGKTGRPTVDGKIKRVPRCRTFSPNYLSAHCFWVIRTRVRDGRAALGSTSH
jgi:hypothetical protein